MKNFLNSQELPHSPSHSQQTKEKRELIRKEIQAKDTAMLARNLDNISEDMGSLEDELNELENDENLKKITQRIQERQSLEHKKLGLIRSIRPDEDSLVRKPNEKTLSDLNKSSENSQEIKSRNLNNSKEIKMREFEKQLRELEGGTAIKKSTFKPETSKTDDKKGKDLKAKDRKEIKKPELPLSQDQLLSLDSKGSQENSREVKKRDFDKKIKELEDIPKAKPQEVALAFKENKDNIEIIETFGSNLDLSQGLQEFVNPAKNNNDTGKKASKEASIESSLHLEPEKQLQFNYTDFVVARTKIQRDWLSRKKTDDYPLYMINAFLLMKCLHQLQNLQEGQENEAPIEKEEEKQEDIDKIETDPEKLKTILDLLRKSFKITHYATPKETLIDRANFLIMKETEAVLMKKGQRFGAVQQRVALIPGFLSLYEEAVQKVSFRQKSKSIKVKGKVFGFPDEVFRFRRSITSPPGRGMNSAVRSEERLEPKEDKGSFSSRNLDGPADDRFQGFQSRTHAVPWPAKKGLAERIDLSFADRKFPVALFSSVSENARKIYDFMVLKKIIKERFDIKGFFEKYSKVFHFRLALKINESIQRIAEQSERNRKAGREQKEKEEVKIDPIFEDNPEKSLSPERKAIGKNSPIVPDKKTDFKELDEDFDSEPEKPEERINLEPKNVVHFESILEQKEKVRFLRGSPVLAQVNRTVLSRFLEKWLEAAYAIQDSRLETSRKVKVSIGVSKVEIPQKLCFYKPRLELSVEMVSRNKPEKEENDRKTKKTIRLSQDMTAPSRINSKTLDLHIESRLSQPKTSFNMLNFLEKSSTADIASILASNDTVMVWKPSSCSPMAFLTEENSEYSLILEIYDEAGFSLLSNMAQNLSETAELGSPNHRDKFITHSLKVKLNALIGSRRLKAHYLSVQPLFSKSNETDIIERILVEVDLAFDPASVSTGTGFNLLTLDPIFNTTIRPFFSLTPKFLKSQETMDLFEKVELCDFQEKFEVFHDFSEEKCVKKFRTSIFERISELSAKGYIKSCSNFQRLCKSVKEFNEILEKIEVSLLETGENSENYLEFLTGLACKGFPNEVRGVVWLFQQRPRFLEMARLALNACIKDPSSEPLKKLKATLEKQINSKELFEVVLELSIKDSSFQLGLKSLKSDYLGFLSDLNLEKDEFWRNKKGQNQGFLMISMAEFFFGRIMNRPLIVSRELIRVLAETRTVFENKYSFFGEEEEDGENKNRNETFIMFLMIIMNHLSRYYLLFAVENTKNFQKSVPFLHPDFRFLKGDLVLLRENLRERLPEVFKLLELGSGLPTSLDFYFAEAYPSLLSSLGLRKDLLFRLWDVILSLEMFEGLRKNADIEIFPSGNNSSVKSSEIAISESYKFYITAFLMAAMRRTAKYFKKNADFPDFYRKMQLVLGLVEDVDEFVNELLFERQEILDFLGKKAHILLDLENQHLAITQKSSGFLRNARKTLGLMGFGVGNLQAHLNYREGAELEAGKREGFLHVYLHFIQVYHNTGSENCIIIELFYDKSSFFFTFPNNTEDRKIRLDFYEKMSFSARAVEASLRIYESPEKMPEKVDAKFRNQLRLLKFCSISLRNVIPNIVFSRFYKLVTKEASYNFAASEAFISLLIEREDFALGEQKASNVKGSMFSKNLMSQNLNSKPSDKIPNEGYFSGNRKLGDFMEDYEEEIRLDMDIIERSLDPIRDAVADVQEIKRSNIHSSLLVDLCEAERESFQGDFNDFKSIFKTAELKPQPSESDLIQLYQSLTLMNQSAKLFNRLDFMLTLIINAKASYSLKKTLLFHILQKGNRVTLTRFKAFVLTFYRLMSANFQINEIENLIENLLMAIDFPIDFPYLIKKASLEIRIAKSFSQNYDIRDYFLLFLAKKHRFLKSKCLFFGNEGDFSLLRQILEQNRQNNPKIRDFFNFVENNVFDQGSKNEIILKIAYSSPIRCRETLEVHLDRSFHQLGMPSTRNNYEYRFYSDEKENFPVSPDYEMQRKPLIKLMALHGNILPLTLWDYPIDRRTFNYLLRRLPFIEYYLQMIRTLNSIEYVASSFNESKGFNLWVQIVLEEEKLISLLLDVDNSENFESLEEIQRNYFVLANQWREKYNQLLMPSKKGNPSDSTVWGNIKDPLTKSVNNRNRIFDKEIKVLGISLFMPLESLILKTQKILLETLLKNAEDYSLSKPSFYQWDLFRTFFYLHLPNKIHRIEASSNDLFQLVQGSCSELKMLVLEYKVRKPDNPLFQTLDSSLGFKEKSILTRDSLIFGEFRQLALYRFADHSTEWLDAKVLSSQSIARREAKGEKASNESENFSFFEVEFAVFPEEKILKKPSEVIFIEKIDLWRICTSRSKGKGMNDGAKNDNNGEILAEYFQKKGYIADRNQEMSNKEGVLTMETMEEKEKPQGSPLMRNEEKPKKEKEMGEHFDEAQKKNQKSERKKELMSVTESKKAEAQFIESMSLKMPDGYNIPHKKEESLKINAVENMGEPSMADSHEKFKHLNPPKDTRKEKNPENTSKRQEKPSDASSTSDKKPIEKYLSGENKGFDNANELKTKNEKSLDASSRRSNRPASIQLDKPSDNKNASRPFEKKDSSETRARPNLKIETDNEGLSKASAGKKNSMGLKIPSLEMLTEENEKKQKRAKEMANKSMGSGERKEKNAENDGEYDDSLELDLG